MRTFVQEIASFGALLSFGAAVVMWGEGLAHLSHMF